MQDAKNVVVVADKSLRKHGVKFVHVLSKLPGIKASLYTPLQWEHNEFEETGKNYAIFLGKNKSSRPYIDLIESPKTEYGVCWGYDGPKAAIYIEKYCKDIPSLEKAIEKTEIRLMKNFANAGIFIAGGIALGLIGIGIIASVKALIKRNKIKHLQYQYGILKFLEDYQEKYLRTTNE